VKYFLRFGFLVMGLAFCLGCGDGGPAPSTEAETEELYESEDYEKQMLGEMGGEAADTGGGEQE
jgi:hypothetical protein